MIKNILQVPQISFSQSLVIGIGSCESYYCILKTGIQNWDTYQIASTVLCIKNVIFFVTFIFNKHPERSTYNVNITCFMDIQIPHLFIHKLKTRNLCILRIYIGSIYYNIFNLVRIYII